MSPKVAIVMINYNGLADTQEALISLGKITYHNYSIVLVDNNSTGDDVEILGERMAKRFGNKLRIIKNSENYGFTGGNNIGIKYAMKHINPDYILLLSNDTIVDPKFLTELVNTVGRHKQVGAVVATICLYQKPHRIESTGLGVNMWRGQSYRLNWMRRNNKQSDKVREVTVASTNAFLIPKAIIEKVGLFDEDYFIYHDDVDYCLRIRKAGYVVLYAPKAIIWHKVGAATRKRTGMAYYYLARNNFRFMRKHATKWQYRCFLVYFFSFHLWLMTAVYLAYFRQPKVVSGYYRGVRDGLCNVRGINKLYR